MARPFVLVGIATLAALDWAACSVGFEVDQDEYCRRRPHDAVCPAAGAGGTAGVSGGTGQGGASGDAGTAGAAGIGGGGASGSGASGSGGSGGLVCAAPKVDCSGSCVDVKADDATNCGACGRSCLGAATCTSGACVPEVMASGEVAPYALADDGTNLYWVSPAIKGDAAFSRMRRVAKASAGGTAENVFSSTIVRARSLAFGGGKLFWGDLGANPTDTNQELRFGTPGTGACCTTVEAAQLNVQHVALAGGKVYWSLTGDSAVRGKNADGTGAVAPNVLGQSIVGWLAVDAEAKPYWLAGVPREVRRLATSPANTGEKVADSASGVAVELAGGRVYWADGAAVRSAAKTDTIPATGQDEFSGHGKIEGFRVEVAGGTGGAGGAAGAGGVAGAGGAGGAGGSGGATLYVLTTQGQRLQAWRKGPSDEAPLLLGEVATKATTYAGNPFGAAHVLTDATHVYFADPGTVDTSPEVDTSEGDGVLYRVAK